MSKRIVTITTILLLLTSSMPSLLVTHHSSLVTVFGQSATATLSGTVTDEQGALVPGARVKVTNTAMGFERQAATSDEGAFTIPLLLPGNYTLTVERDGFAQARISNVILNVNDRRTLQIELKAGSVTEVVTVDVASLINESPAVGTVIDRQFVGNLPLNGRSFQSLILLAPGVVPTPGTSVNPGEFSVNGQRATANYFTVDGVSANTGVAFDSVNFSQQAAGALPGATALGTTASLVSVDALEEFRMQTSTYSAEFGRQPGAQVQLVTRSGKNQLNGSLFHYLRNEALDARNWFNKKPQPEPALRQNQFGGTFSGPVLIPAVYNGKDRTFFFFSYEGQRMRLPQLPQTDIVPALWLREAAAETLKPFLNAYPLPNSEETQALIDHDRDPSTPRVLGPSGLAPFIAAYSNPSSVDAYSIRMDHAISSKLNLFGRYAQTPSNNLTRQRNWLFGADADSRALTVGAMISITPRLNNDFRINYTRNKGGGSYRMDDFGGAVPVTLEQMISPYRSSGPGPISTCFSFGGSFRTVYCLGDFAGNYQRQLNIVDNVSWVKGSHQLKFGIDWRRLTPIYGPQAYSSQFQIASSGSFDVFFDLNQIDLIKSGTVGRMVILASQVAHPIFDNYSVYAQDTWKLSPRLTLDLGLRWEVNPPPHEANGVMPVLITGITDTDVSNATLAPPGTPFYSTIYTAFAPRVGVAYQLNQTTGRETVARGGFGIYYDLGSNMATAGFRGYPFSASTSLFNVTLPLSPAQVQPPGFPAVTLPLPPSANLFALNPDLKLPYTLQWSVALQQMLGKNQMVTLSYVASAGRRLTATSNLNGVPSATVIENLSNRQIHRPNPNFNDIAFNRNRTTSDYHSLQAQYQSRLSRGLQALVNYTWSHAIDEASLDSDGLNPLERGNADFDVRHNFSAAVTYDFPKLSGAGPLAALLMSIANGWSMDSVFYAYSGKPLNILAGVTNYLDGRQVVVHPDRVPGAPVWIDDPSAPGGQRINPAAFAYPPFTLFEPLRQRPGSTIQLFSRPGTLGRNSIRAPGIYQINMGVRRQFNLGERWTLQLKAEAFNILNHPLFAGYDTVWSPTSATFGAPRNTLSAPELGTFPAGLSSLYQLGGPRSIQLSLRLAF